MTSAARFANPTPAGPGPRKPSAGVLFLTALGSILTLGLMMLMVLGRSAPDEEAASRSSSASPVETTQQQPDPALPVPSVPEPNPTIEPPNAPAPALPARELVQTPIVKTPEEIRKFLATMGNTKTVVNVGKQETYAFLDLRGYFKLFVETVEAEIVHSAADGFKLTDGAGRNLSMMSMAAAFFLLKDERGFPQANAAIGYIPLKNGEYTAVFVMAVEGGYTAFLKDDTTPLLSKDGYLGIMIKGDFIRFKYLEFDLPTGSLPKPSTGF